MLIYDNGTIVLEFDVRWTFYAQRVMVNCRRGKNLLARDVVFDVMKLQLDLIGLNE